jgi:hypothetical protein
MILSRDIFQETSIAYHSLQRCHWTICKNVALICNGQVINQILIYNAWFDIFFTLLVIAKTRSTHPKDFQPMNHKPQLIFPSMI